MSNAWSRAWQEFPVRDQTVNNSGFEHHMVSAAMAHLCPVAGKQPRTVCEQTKAAMFHNNFIYGQ